MRSRDNLFLLLTRPSAPLGVSGLTSGHSRPGAEIVHLLIFVPSVTTPSGDGRHVVLLASSGSSLRPGTSSEVLHIRMNLQKTRGPLGTSLREARYVYPLTKEIQRWHFHSKNKWIFFFFHIPSWENVLKNNLQWRTGGTCELVPTSWTLSFRSFHAFLTTLPVLMSPAVKFPLASQSRVTEFSFN